MEDIITNITEGATPSRKPKVTSFIRSYEVVRKTFLPIIPIEFQISLYDFKEIKSPDMKKTFKITDLDTPTTIVTKMEAGEVPDFTEILKNKYNNTLSKK